MNNDIPLAAEVIAKGTDAISTSGKLHTTHSIA
ncbi:MAG: hypothetical protein EKK64_07180 [Neisseriaceae bacterium]|nr:MAG: hypothetical protein EKK64_07180 [Neisseriaceae bacterium]